MLTSHEKLFLRAEKPNARENLSDDDRGSRHCRMYQVGDATVTAAPSRSLDSILAELNGLRIVGSARVSNESLMTIEAVDLPDPDTEGAVKI